MIGDCILVAALLNLCVSVFIILHVKLLLILLKKTNNFSEKDNYEPIMPYYIKAQI